MRGVVLRSGCARFVAALLFAWSHGCAGAAREADGPRAPYEPPPLDGVRGTGVSTSEAVRPELSGEGEDWVVGRIAGLPLTARELFVEWQRRAPREFWFVADKLVAARLAQVEASRLGLRMTAELVQREVALDRERQEEELRRAADGAPLEAFLRRSLGFEPEAYFASLRQGTLERLTAERVVRAWTLSRSSRSVRVIAVPGTAGDAGAVEVRRRLDAGEDFAAVARALSIDDTAAAGGLVPFLLDEAGSPLARMAFLAGVGELVGPLDSGPNQLFLRIESERVPREGPWREVGELVEETLAAHPVGDAEYLLWKLAMDRQHTVDLGPLEQLARE